MILCRSCVNLKKISVVFMLLKIDLSELCHLDSSVIASFFKLNLSRQIFSKESYT